MPKTVMIFGVNENVVVLLFWNWYKKERYSLVKFKTVKENMDLRY